MKTKFALICLLALIAYACGSDDASPYKCSTCVDAPEALAANDASGKGIYKGLVVGSSGTIKFNIANENGSTTITAVLTFDDVEYALTTSGTYTDGGFQGAFINAAAEISIYFSVSASGVASISSITIPGHPNVSIEIFKELSTALVAVFEGTYSGDASGTFNLVTKGTECIIVAKDGDPQGGCAAGCSFYGTVSADGTVIKVQGDVTISGKIDGDNVTGTWVSPDESGSWKGKRTL